MDRNHDQDSLNLHTEQPESVPAFPNESVDAADVAGTPSSTAETVQQAASSAAVQAPFDSSAAPQAPVENPAPAQVPLSASAPQAPAVNPTPAQVPLSASAPQAPVGNPAPAQVPYSASAPQVPSAGQAPRQMSSGTPSAPVAPQGGAVIHNHPYTPQRTGMAPPPYRPSAYPPQAVPNYQGAVPPRTVNPKKEKKHGSREIGWVIAMCVVLSFLCGLGGTILGFTFSAQRRTTAVPDEQSTTVPLDTAEPGDVTLPSGSELTEADPDNKKILSVKGVYEKNADAVVEIVTEYVTYYFRNENTSEGAGSGVILTQDGYIVTNYHVIDSADTVHVRLKNGDYYEATVVGSDQDSDIAILKIDATGLTVASLGDSSSIAIGDLCVAIGNPLGTLGGTVTDGIISALDREITIDGETMRLLQHNAAVSPGNSGGGLFNENGDLIGIVNAKSSGSGVEGIGFAIPINSVKSIIDDLVTDGYVHGKFKLGLNLVNISDQRSAAYYNVTEYGIYISEVAADSNAELAGLKSGDLVRTINGEKIENFEQIEDILANSKAGDVLTFVVDRDGSDMEIPVTLHEYIPKDIAA